MSFARRLQILNGSNTSVFSFFGDFSFFGGGGMREQEHERPRGGDVIMDLFVTLEELYTGNFIEVNFRLIALDSNFKNINYDFHISLQKCFHQSGTEKSIPRITNWHHKACQSVIARTDFYMPSSHR